MFSNRQRKFIQATFVQFSGIIGAGIFVLPYAFGQNHFYLPAVGLILITLVLGLLHLFYVDIIGATAGDHQLSGYAQIYLGNRFRYLSLFNILLLSVGALFAYVRLSTSFLQIVFPSLSSSLAVFSFFFGVVLIYFFSLHQFGQIKTVLSFVSILLILYLFSLSLTLPPSQISDHIPTWSFFGPTVFALTGFTIIPEVEEILRGRSDKIRLVRFASLSGLFIAAVIYLAFSFAVIKICNFRLTPDSVIGLYSVSPVLGQLFSFLGFLIILQAASNILVVIKESFYRDFHLKLPFSHLLTLVVFTLPYIFNKLPLIFIVSITGSITILVSAIIICLIRIRLQPNYRIIAISLVIILFLLLGSLAEFGH